MMTRMPGIFLLSLLCLAGYLTQAQSFKSTATDCSASINETGPGAVSHNDGTNITFHANGGGTGATYYWNGPHGPGSGNTYSLNPMSMADAGIYTLMAVGGHTGGGSSTVNCDTQYVYDTLIVNAVVNGVPSFSEHGTDDIRVYPVPSAGIVNVTLPQHVKEATVTITDVTGRALIIKWSGGVNEVPCDLSPFGKGIYFIRVQTELCSKVVTAQLR